MKDIGFIILAVPTFIFLSLAATRKQWVLWLISALPFVVFAYLKSFPHTDYGVFFVFLFLVTAGFRNKTLGYTLAWISAVLWGFFISAGWGVPAGYVVIAFFAMWVIYMFNLFPDYREEIEDTVHEGLNENVKKGIGKGITYLLFGFLVMFFMGKALQDTPEVFWMYDVTARHSLIFFIIVTVWMVFYLMAKKWWISFVFMALACVSFTAYYSCFDNIGDDTVCMWAVFLFPTAFLLRNISSFSEKIREIQEVKMYAREFCLFFGREAKKRQKGLWEQFLSNKDHRYFIRNAAMQGGDWVHPDVYRQAGRTDVMDWREGAQERANPKITY